MRRREDDRVPAHRTSENTRCDRKVIELTLLKSDMWVCDPSGGEHCLRHVHADNVEATFRHKRRGSAWPASNIGDVEDRLSLDQLDEGQEQRLVDRAFCRRTDRGPHELDIPRRCSVIDGSGGCYMVLVGHAPRLCVRSPVSRPGHRLLPCPRGRGAKWDTSGSPNDGRSIPAVGHSTTDGEHLNSVPSGNERARAFLPSKDFEISKAFYIALGFTMVLEGDVAIFAAGESEIILTRFYQKEYAENFVMQILVDDLDAWWTHISTVNFQSDSVSRPRSSQRCSRGG